MSPLPSTTLFLKSKKEDKVKKPLTRIYQLNSLFPKIS